MVGRMVAGDKLLAPRAEPMVGDFVEGEVREKVRRRLQEFLRAEIARHLAPLFTAQELPLAGIGRGVVYQLVDALGCLPTTGLAGQIAALAPVDRRALSRLGVRFGTESVYIEPLLRAEMMRFQALLWAIWQSRSVPKLPSARRLARPIELDPDLPVSFYEAIGLRIVNGLALRPDRLERVAAAARRLARQGPFRAGAELAAVAGIEPGALRAVLAGLGYRAVIDADGESFVARPRRRRENVKGDRHNGRSGEAHPFAKLRELKLA
jgi:ATP-dependent RNA helicase SUPV3L1/SUV3